MINRRDLFKALAGGSLVLLTGRNDHKLPELSGGFEVPAEFQAELRRFISDPYYGLTAPVIYGRPIVYQPDSLPPLRGVSFDCEDENAD